MNHILPIKLVLVYYINIKTSQFLVLRYQGRKISLTMHWEYTVAVHTFPSLVSSKFIKPDVLNNDSHTDLICKWAHSRWLQPISLKFIHLRKLGREKAVQPRGHLCHRNRNESISLLSLACGVIHKSPGFPVIQCLTCESGIPLYLTGMFWGLIH